MSKNKRRLYRTKKRLALFTEGINAVTNTALTGTNLQNMAGSYKDIKYPDVWHVIFNQATDTLFDFEEFFKNKEPRHILNLCLQKYIESFLSLKDLTNETIQQLRKKMKEINAPK